VPHRLLGQQRRLGQVGESHPLGRKVLEDGEVCGAHVAEAGRLQPFHGYRFILAEFIFTIALGAALGLWISHSAFSEGRAVSPIRLVLGAYFLCVAINYVPLLLYGIAIARRNSAHDEVAAEVAEGGRYLIVLAAQDAEAAGTAAAATAVIAAS
jgi:hypothetical protein